jgi:mannitol-1-phosphate 5-dehydrogenase
MSSDYRSQVIIFGAGTVGRGFLGQLFFESGFTVIFVDIDERLVDELNRRGSYFICLVTEDICQYLNIGNVRAFLPQQKNEIIQALTEVELGATAVGARSLPHIAPLIASGIHERAAMRIQTPLNIVVCENMKNAAVKLKDMVRKDLPDRYWSYFDNHVGFVDAVIARMGPILTNEEREDDYTRVVVEPYKLLPVNSEAFIGTIPEIIGFEPQDNFQSYVDRKLYLHNAIHSMLGFLGYYRNHKYCYQALNDPAIIPIVEKAIKESKAALVAEYNFESIALQEYVDDLLERMANRALGDTIFRLARDPIRKLSSSDRLVGAACLALKHGIEPDGLACGIAAGLAYDDPNDTGAVKLQGIIMTDGIIIALRDICGLLPNSHLEAMVLKRYKSLRRK